VCGDFNVAANPIDIKNPKANEHNAGYTIQEREAFKKLLDSGFVDSFRHLYHEEKDIYSWWSYRFNARAKNIGWRLDYFLISDFEKDNIIDSKIHTDVMGSDHCPVSLDVNI
jgi:exodeoxyribonuclease-3